MASVGVIQIGYGTVNCQTTQPSLTLKRYMHKPQIEWKAWYEILGQRVFWKLMDPIMMNSKQIRRCHCTWDALCSLGYLRSWLWSTWRPDLGGVTKVSLSYLCYWTKCFLTTTNYQRVTTRQRRYFVLWVWSTRKFMHAVMIVSFIEMSLRKCTIAQHMGYHDTNWPMATALMM